MTHTHLKKVDIFGKHQQKIAITRTQQGIPCSNKPSDKFNLKFGIN